MEARSKEKGFLINGGKGRCCLKEDIYSFKAHHMFTLSPHLSQHILEILHGLWEVGGGGEVHNAEVGGQISDHLPRHVHVIRLDRDLAERECGQGTASVKSEEYCMRVSIINCDDLVEKRIQGAPLDLGSRF